MNKQTKTLSRFKKNAFVYRILPGLPMMQQYLKRHVPRNVPLINWNAPLNGKKMFGGVLGIITTQSQKQLKYTSSFFLMKSPRNFSRCQSISPSNLLNFLTSSLTYVHTYTLTYQGLHVTISVWLFRIAKSVMDLFFKYPHDKPCETVFSRYISMKIVW